MAKVIELACPHCGQGFGLVARKYMAESVSCPSCNEKVKSESDRFVNVHDEQLQAFLENDDEPEMGEQDEW